jgi:hypothetical protein
MAAVTTQAVVNGALTTPTAITASASDTIARSQFGPTGVFVRVITTGTLTNLTVTDPTRTGLSNAGTPPVLACPATGARKTLIPLAAIDPASDNATINFSSIVGVTYELDKV